MNIFYHKATTEDINEITELTMILYYGDYSVKKHEYDELYRLNKKDLINPKMAMFLALNENKAIGFAHASLRYDYVEGTNSGNVGYLEGIFVKPDYRGNGIAKTLVSLCENWSKENGCVEFASDCQVDNLDGLKFHLKVGFQEANRIICFTKKI